MSAGAGKYDEGVLAGKYDDAATAAREATKAEGVLLIVLGGEKGSGFSVQIPPEFVARIPAMLRRLADEIESPKPENEA